MAYSAVQAASFSGGLNLRDSYEQMEVNQALDLLNVAFDNRGGVKSRPGYEKFAPSTNGTNRYDSLIAYYKTDGTKQLVCGAGNRLEVFDSAGAAVGSASTSPTANPHFFTRFGGPTKTVVYAANGTDSLRTWDGSAWATPTFTGMTASPKGKYLSVTPWDNRLVNANLTPASPSVAGANRSTVFFSDPSVPDTWQTYNWVDLTPGDGEQIMGLCAFNNFILAFKETKFFVFYGTSINPEDGTPEFNYRAVDTGVGLAAPQALCVAPDAVYFLSGNGVYRTTGGAPQLISSLIDPIFGVGEIPALYGGYAINASAIDKCRMAYHNMQVFLSIPVSNATSNNQVLMFDLRNQSWTVWNVPAAAMTTFKIGTQPDLVFAYATGDKHIGRLRSSLSTDAGAGISSRIKIAFNDYGENAHKTIRESKVWGTGKVRFGMADDFGVASNARTVAFGNVDDKWADGSDASDNWADGTDPNDKWAAAVGTRAVLVRSAIRGAYLSIEISDDGTSTPIAWSVNKIVHHLRDRRVPSVTNLDGE